jgi:hypothetical protein
MSATVEYEAKALYDYDAKSESELTLRVGQLVRVVEEFDTGWFVVECEREYCFLYLTCVCKLLTN